MSMMQARMNLRSEDDGMKRQRNENVSLLTVNDAETIRNATTHVLFVKILIGINLQGAHLIS